MKTAPLASLMLGILTSTFAAHPIVENLHDYPVEELLYLKNGSVEAASLDGRKAWRWKVNTGQSGDLAIRSEHELFDRLRYYDRLQFEYRIVSGEVSSISFNAVGHVSGPRQYKVHNQRIALVTTERKVWHQTELDLADAYWFPWDKPDGEGETGYFTFNALAIAPDTVIELRDVRLVRGLLYLKRDFQSPVTWPQKTENEDGSVTYTLDFGLLNTSGRPTSITAKVTSANQVFKTSLDNEAIEVKASQIASFKVTATMSKAALDASEELFAEPLRLEFATSHRPEATTRWAGRLVRPLSKGLRRQVMIATGDLELIRQQLSAGDDEMRKIVNYDRVVARADELVGKTLQTIPQSYNHVRNGYPNPWMPGNIMSEAVNPQTGERRIGDATAGAVWREYLAYSGQATYYNGLAYAFTQDEKYARKAIKLMRLYAQQYAQHKWHVLFDVPWFPGPPIQSSSRIASNSSYGSNWEFKWHCKMLSLIADSPSWTDADRKFVYEGWVRPYATELVKLNASISNQTDITNHNLLLLGLAFDDALIVWNATLRDCGLVSRLKDIDEDGFSSEGRPLNYHGAAADEYLPSVTHLENSGLKINYGRERILAAIRMPYERAALNGLVPNTGDCGRGQGAGPSNLADVVVSLAPDAKWLMDIGQGSSISASLQRYRSKSKAITPNWTKLLSTKPRLFGSAGLAILRSGDTADTQVMVTLDYGRSVFHSALDRNQITLTAFGRIFTHGTGSLYNAGSGGIQYNQDPKLKSFIDGRVSLSNNVLVVDQRSQLPTVGKLLAWSETDDFQVAVSRLDGLYPGVSHTRGVVLTKRIVIVFDQIRSEQEHSYDLVYHNFGDLKFGDDWSAAVTGPLGSTANYDNIVSPRALTGKGPLQATWDMTRQYPYWNKSLKVDETKLPPIHLKFVQLAPEGCQFFTGITGLNNTNTKIISDEAPTLISRLKSMDADFVSVLEPFKEESRVAEVIRKELNGISVRLTDGSVIATSLDELLDTHKVPIR